MSSSVSLSLSTSSIDVTPSVAPVATATRGIAGTVSSTDGGGPFKQHGNGNGNGDSYRHLILPVQFKRLSETTTTAAAVDVVSAETTTTSAVDVVPTESVSAVDDVSAETTTTTTTDLEVVPTETTVEDVPTPSDIVEPSPSSWIDYGHHDAGSIAETSRSDQPYQSLPPTPFPTDSVSSLLTAAATVLTTSTSSISSILVMTSTSYPSLSEETLVTLPETDKQQPASSSAMSNPAIGGIVAACVCAALFAIGLFLYRTSSLRNTPGDVNPTTAEYGYRGFEDLENGSAKKATKFIDIPHPQTQQATSTTASTYPIMPIGYTRNDSQVTIDPEVTYMDQSSYGFAMRQSAVSFGSALDHALAEASLESEEDQQYIEPLAQVDPEMITVAQQRSRGNSIEGTDEDSTIALPVSFSSFLPSTDFRPLSLPFDPNAPLTSITPLEQGSGSDSDEDTPIAALHPRLSKNMSLLPPANSSEQPYVIQFRTSQMPGTPLLQAALAKSMENNKNNNKIRASMQATPLSMVSPGQPTTTLSPRRYSESSGSPSSVQRPSDWNTKRMTKFRED